MNSDRPDSGASKRALIEWLGKPFTSIGRRIDAALVYLFPPVTPPTVTVAVREHPAPPPAVAPEGTFLIGHAATNKEAIYALSTQLDRHLLIIGGTGCGKTTLIARLFTEEITKWQ